MNAPARRPGLIYIRKDPSWDEHGWTSVPNAVLRDSSLSWEARGAFAWMASHRTTFSLRSEDLAEAGPKGRNHARDMLRELEERGWLTRHKERNPDTGRHELTIYNLHPIQVPQAGRTWVKSTAKAAPALTEKLEKPQVSPATERPGAGRPVAERPVAEREGASHAHCLDPLEDHLLTEGENHTPAREAEAAPPPRVNDQPIIEFPDEILEPSDEEVQLELKAIRVEERQRQDRRVKNGFRELAKDPCIQESLPIVERFEQRTNRLTPYGQRKWRAAVSEMLKLNHEVVDIEGGMDLAVEEGGNWSWLESKTLVVKKQRLAGKLSRGEVKFKQHLQNSHDRFGSHPADLMAEIFPNAHRDEGVGQPPQPALEA